jgi:hypothetical protein
MSYCMIEMILLSLYRRELTQVCCSSGNDLDRRSIFEGCQLKAGIDGLGYVRGRLVRRWTSRGGVRKLHGGANL